MAGRSIPIAVFSVFFLLFTITLVLVIVALSIREGETVYWTTDQDDVPFWQSTVVYQVYPRSFSDVLPDGTGDLVGITSKVDYLRELGVGVVWLSPIYESPMKDFGYDISNFTAIDPLFGTLEEFDTLVASFHQNGLKVVMDFVPNHSSDQHEWFAKSVKREDPYTDYYVWADSKGTDENGTQIPPNNWVSVFRGSAWEWSQEREQFYYHQFLVSQPDLNFRSQAVREEMKDVLRFWLDKGIDGFRVDAVLHLLEVEDLSLDEPKIDGADDPDDYASLNHTYTSDQPESLTVLREWRKLIDTYTDKLLMVEIYTDKIDVLMKYYGNETEPLADFPFNFLMIESLQNRTQLTGESLKKTVSRWLDNLPEGKWPTWVMGNHDVRRVSSRIGPDLVDAMNMINLLLPGTPVTYYGEEIGMQDTFISWEDTQDPQGCHWGPEHYQEHSRDPARTPMQWDDSKNAGFSSASDTWLPVNPNYKSVNVAAQVVAHTSHLKVYQELATLRREPTFIKGNISFPVVTKDIFSFRRSQEDLDQYLVVVNTSRDPVEANLLEDSTEDLPQKATVVLRSISDTEDTTKPGSEVLLDKLPLTGGEGIVLLLP